MSDPRVTVELLARSDLSVKAVLEEAWGKQWQEVLNDTGTGKVTLANDDPDLALVEYGDYLRFSLDGVVRFASIVETMERTHIAPSEEVDENTVIAGRGALAVLENAVVYPDLALLELESAPFTDARAFNFSSVFHVGQAAYGWTTGYDWGDRASAGSVYANMPADFPAVASRWVGPQAPTGGDDQPLGAWYFSALWPGLPEGRYRLFFGWDDAIELWIDNVPVFTSEETTFAVTKAVDVYLTAGGHIFGAKIVNRASGGLTNPTGFTAALCSINEDDTIDTLEWNSDATAPDQWVIPYPSPSPGFTPGMIMFLTGQLEAVSFRGVPTLDQVTFGFDGDDDSNGTPWAETIAPSVQIGTDLLTFFKQIAEGSFEMWFDPANWRLEAYQTRGGASGVVYTEAENITNLQHSGKF